ncbi:MAG: type I methionyl aminopeptidase [Leptospirales bacterium]|nr:type I methionyl aminopeptidase [Leptospirales bacterium]
MIHIKNNQEIQKMREAGKLAAEVLAETGLRVAAGVSTLELNDFAHRFTIKRGAESAPLNYRGFPKSICSSINDVVCHGIPSKKDVLKDGDIINLDITVRLKGYHGDTSRMFKVGQISADAERLLQDTERAMWIGIEQIRPEARVCDIGEAIDGFLSPLGYGIVRDLTGHGIGRSFHEEPSIPHYRQRAIRDRLRAGMIFTVEPMVNRGGYQVEFDEGDGWTVRTKDGSLSAQYEHTCLVTDGGYEILTRLGE